MAVGVQSLLTHEALPQGMGVLDARNHQGKFGQDYIRVLASAAGLLVYTPDLDYNGVDLLIRWPETRTRGGRLTCLIIVCTVVSQCTRRYTHGLE